VLYERHLLFDNVVDPARVGARDLTAYLEADRRLVQLYTDPEGWAHKAVLNVAASGNFSSDRTIAEYAAETWDARPCPLP
jgi:starch phosphorylase